VENFFARFCTGNFSFKASTKKVLERTQLIPGPIKFSYDGQPEVLHFMLMRKACAPDQVYRFDDVKMSINVDKTSFITGTSSVSYTRLYDIPFFDDKFRLLQCQDEMSAGTTAESFIGSVEDFASFLSVVPGNAGFIEKPKLNCFDKNIPMNANNGVSPNGMNAKPKEADMISNLIQNNSSVNLAFTDPFMSNTISSTEINRINQEFARRFQWNEAGTAPPTTNIKMFQKLPKPLRITSKGVFRLNFDANRNICDFRIDVRYREHRYLEPHEI